MLPNPVPPLQLVLTSKPVNPWNSGFVHPNSIRGAIRRLRHQDMFRQAPAVAPAVEPQPIEVSDDEDGSWLSLRPLGEPQQE